MSNNSDLLYYCDSYPAIGNGHLKRGLDIIKQVLKIQPQINIAMAGHYSESAWKFLQKLVPQTVEIYRNEMPDNKYKLSILDTINPGDADTIPQDKCKKLQAIAKRVFTINTGIETFIPDCIDGIINYIPLTKYYGNEDVKKYLGVEYAPVSSEFQPVEPVFNKRILGIIGGNRNQYGPEILGRVLKRILPEEYKIDFILSPHFPAEKKEGLERFYPDVNFYQNLTSIVQPMQNAQAIITTYGNATWEALTLHKPVFIVSYLDFQKYFAAYLEKQGYAIDLGYLKNLYEDKFDLLTDREYQKTKIKSLEKVFQTPGIQNIAKLILEEINVS